MAATERELIEKLREGDPGAFRELYQRTARSLFQYALFRLGGNEEAAQDAVAETYADALDHAASLSLNHKLEAWLYRIAQGKVVDYIRRHCRRREWIRRAGPLQEHKEASGGPEDQALREEDKRLIRAAFFRMDAEAQKALKRKYLENASTREIAAETGKTEKAVESLLYRAKKEFARELERMGKDRVYLPDGSEGSWHSLFQIIF